MLKILITCSLLFDTSAVVAKEPTIVMEEFRVPSDDPGIELYVGNKHPQGVKKFAPDKIPHYVRGATSRCAVS
jgi:hypothetical protein